MSRLGASPLTAGKRSAGDRKLVEKCYSFALDGAIAGSGDVQNAIGVSFIEHLNFRDGKVQRRWA